MVDEPAPALALESPPRGTRVVGSSRDLVLMKAVITKVLASEDAALIGDTRLGLMTVSDAAECLGISTSAAYEPPPGRGEVGRLAGSTGPSSPGKADFPCTKRLWQ